MRVIYEFARDTCEISRHAANNRAVIKAVDSDDSDGAERHRNIAHKRAFYGYRCGKIAQTDLHDYHNAIDDGNFTVFLITRL